MDGLLRQGLEALSLPTAGISSLLRFADMLSEKNKVMNLTAITEPSEIATLHFLDSACLLAEVDFRSKRVVDVGTGAGFPGLPLRILEPSIQLTLEDVACVHGRAEEFAAGQREQFDIAVSRAVASLPLLAELCLPLVRPGGWFLAMKSVDSDQEIAAASRAIETLGGQLSAARDYTIPLTGVRHRLVIIKKVAQTPKKYPRAFAKIKKNPL